MRAKLLWATVVLLGLPFVASHAQSPPRPEPQKEQWKSITTGTDKIIQRDGDRIYVETVLPEYLREVGCSTMSDLKKQGDIYLGITKENCVCTYYVRAGMESTHYSIESQIAITKLDTNRIEGWTLAAPIGTKLDCKGNKYTKPPVKTSFVWIPR